MMSQRVIPEVTEDEPDEVTRAPNAIPQEHILDAAYDLLTESADASGTSGDVEWNFEKFLLSAEGRVLGRFRPAVEPDDADLRALIDAELS